MKKGIFVDGKYCRDMEAAEKVVEGLGGKLTKIGKENLKAWLSGEKTIKTIAYLTRKKDVLFSGKKVTVKVYTLDPNDLSSGIVADYLFNYAVSSNVTLKDLLEGFYVQIGNLTDKQLSDFTIRLDKFRKDFKERTDDSVELELEIISNAIEDLFNIIYNE